MSTGSLDRDSVSKEFQSCIVLGEKGILIVTIWPILGRNIYIYCMCLWNNDTYITYPPHLVLYIHTAVANMFRGFDTIESQVISSSSSAEFLAMILVTYTSGIASNMKYSPKSPLVTSDNYQLMLEVCFCQEILVKSDDAPRRYNRNKRVMFFWDAV